MMRCSGETGTIQAELGRCLSRLVPLFHDPSFQADKSLST